MEESQKKSQLKKVKAKKVFSLSYEALVSIDFKGIAGLTSILPRHAKLCLIE